MWPAGNAQLTRSAGTERWRASLPFGGNSPLAAFNGELIMDRGEVRSTLDGSRKVESPGANVVRNPLMGAAGRTLLIDPPSICCPTCPCPAALPRVDALRMKPGSAVHERQKTIAAMGGPTSFVTTSDAVATRQGELLIAGSTNGSVVRLIALNAAGDERFACEIPQSPVAGPNTPSRFDSPVALLGGKWAVVEEVDCPVGLKGVNPILRVFEVPGERPPPHGWVGAGGSASGGSRPLP